MPNWCENRLVLAHLDETKVKEAVDAYNDGKLLNYFKPCPPELHGDGLESYGGDDAEEKDQRREEMKAKYGYQSWYDWQIANWGTKWDIFREESEWTALPAGKKTVNLRFDTAWAPPLEAMAAAEELGFSVQLSYYEPGMDFAGVYQNGVDHPLEPTVYHSFMTPLQEVIQKLKEAE